MDVTPNKRGSFEGYTVSLARRLESEGWRSIQAFWGEPPTWLRADLEATGATLRVIAGEPEFGGREDWPSGADRDRRFAAVSQRLVREYHPDLVHLHFCVAFSLLPLALRLAGARRVLFTEHISLPFIQRNLLRDLAARLRNGLCMRFVSRMLPVSDYVRRRLVLCDHVPAAKAEVVYNGIDLSRFQEGPDTPDVATVRRRLEVPEDHLMVVTIGQLIDFKGIHVLVDAAGLLRHREKVTYLAIGEGERRQALEERAGHLEIGDRFRFLGRRDDVADILRACDLFVLPSIWDEALGYVILEAMSTGKPVVATRTGGIPEVVVDGETGLLVERDDAPALAGAIDTLLMDPARRLDFGRQGRRVVDEKFAMDVSIDHTLRIYNQLVGLARQRGGQSVAGAA
jgi:glycosyltransferase involved in cell wall biosynthesis